MERRSILPSMFGGGGRADDPFYALQSQMNRLFDDVFRSAGAPAAGRGEGMLSPSIDVRETGDSIEVLAELPGVKPEDVDITLDDDMLTIRGEKKFERKEDKENLHVMERSYGSFARAIRLPFAPKAEEVRADYRDGILTVTLPKTAERQQKQHKIRIGSATPGPQQVTQDTGKAAE